MYAPHPAGPCPDCAPVVRRGTLDDRIRAEYATAQERAAEDDAERGCRHLRTIPATRTLRAYCLDCGSDLID